jgi:hypothetical protein
MLIFFDTTELKQNPRLSGAKWEKVRSYLHRTGHVGLITSLVVEETVNHVREDLNDINSNVDSSNSLLENALGKDCEIAFDRIDVQLQLKNYRTALLDRLSELRIEVVEASNVSLNKLVRRALDRRKPFDSNGQKGFRDAIQWETMLPLIGRSEDSAIFVTYNVNDFGQHGTLEKHLADDLDAIDRKGKVTICKGIDLLLREYVEKEARQAGRDFRGNR